jgi:hypothetical protein
MSDEKAKVVKNWQNPRNIKKVQAFLGFANINGWFIKGCSKNCKPLTYLLRKDSTFY